MRVEPLLVSFQSDSTGTTDNIDDKKTKQIHKMNANMTDNSTRSLCRVVKTTNLVCRHWLDRFYKWVSSAVDWLTWCCLGPTLAVVSVAVEVVVTCYHAVNSMPVCKRVEFAASHMTDTRQQRAKVGDSSKSDSNVWWRQRLPACSPSDLWVCVCACAPLCADFADHHKAHGGLLRHPCDCLPVQSKTFASSHHCSLFGWRSFPIFCAFVQLVAAWRSHGPAWHSLLACLPSVCSQNLQEYVQECRGKEIRAVAFSCAISAF